MRAELPLSYYRVELIALDAIVNRVEDRTGSHSMFVCSGRETRNQQASLHKSDESTRVIGVAMSISFPA